MDLLVRDILGLDLLVRDIGLGSLGKRYCGLDLLVRDIVEKVYSDFLRTPWTEISDSQLW